MFLGEDGGYFGHQTLDGFSEYDNDLGEFVRTEANIQLTTESKVVANVDHVYEKGKESAKFELVYENENWFIDEVTNESGFSYKKEMKNILRIWDMKADKILLMVKCIKAKNIIMEYLQK